MALAFSRAGGMHGAANPGLYSLAAQPADGVFHDVTVASSGVADCTPATPSLCNNSDPGSASVTGGLAGYQVASGYDLATGWGSVDVAALVSSWGTALTLTPSSLTIAKGDTGTTLAVVTGMSSPTFACSGLPAHAECEFMADVSGATLKVVTAGGSAAAIAGALDESERSEPPGRAASEVWETSGGGSPLVAWLIAGVGLALVARARRASWRTRAAVLGLAVAAAAASCGSNGDSGKDARMIDAPSAPAGTYTVTVTATSGVAKAAALLSLTITN
jgi:hypothetical protein